MGYNLSTITQFTETNFKTYIMLGINDPAIYLGYLAAIISLIACIIYGIMYWNKGMENSEEEIKKDLDWENKDEQIKSEI